MSPDEDRQARDAVTTLLTECVLWFCESSTPTIVRGSSDQHVIMGAWEGVQREATLQSHMGQVAARVAVCYEPARRIRQLQTQREVQESCVQGGVAQLPHGMLPCEPREQVEEEEVGEIVKRIKKEERKVRNRASAWRSNMRNRAMIQGLGLKLESERKRVGELITRQQKLKMENTALRRAAYGHSET